MQHTTDADAYTQRRTGETKEAAESVAAAVDCVSIERDEPPEETKDVSGVDDEDDGVVIFVVVSQPMLRSICFFKCPLMEAFHRFRTRFFLRRFPP